MKKIFNVIIAFICAGVLFGTIARRADSGFPEEGYWRSVDHKTGKSTAYWNLVVADGMLSGYLVSYANMKPDDKCSACSGGAKDWHNKPIKGTVWLQLKKRKADGTWENGYIIDSSKGAKYKAKVWLENGMLKMRGYVGFMYSTQTWFRATKEQAEAGKF